LEFNAFFGTLRSICQSERRLAVVVTDVHPDCNRINVWSQRGAETNPVFNFFREVFLGPFSEEDTRLMLSDIARLMGKSFDDETLRASIGKRRAPFSCAPTSQFGLPGELRYFGFNCAMEFRTRPVEQPFIMPDF